jgi:benzoate-CoA ligase family protein
MAGASSIPLEIPAQFNIADYFVDRPARQHPDRVAILGEPGRTRYGELRDLVNRAGNAFLVLGCAPGDRILIVLTDSAEFMAAFFGAAKIGAVAVPVNPFARSADYALYLKDSGARYAVADATAWSEFSPALSAVKLDSIISVGPDGTPSATGVHSWAQLISSASPVLAARPMLGSDIAFFLYTSGSGGAPKAAVHEHKDMLVTSACYGQGVLGITSDDITFSVSKLFFAYGLGNGMYYPLSVGARTVLNPERPRIERVVELVAKYRPTLFFAVPTFLAALLREVERGLPADFSSVRLAISAGEALPAEIFTQFKNRFGIEILDGIGSTEMLHMFLSSRAGEARPGSCGIEVPHTQARILDEAGNDVAQGEIGNLWVRGRSALREYWQKPELTARTRRDGWIFTGDKFFRDADGYYHHCGRSDDMLKVSGMWVSSGEVENALLAHPAIAEAAVVGRTDSVGLVSTVACVVLRPGVIAEATMKLTDSDIPAAESCLKQDIRAFVKSRIASYKCPREVVFLDELPKTATGKIQRFKLR